MLSIATCPQCAAQLALPDSALPSDYAQCPECNAEFSLADGQQRWLATARLLPPPPEVEPQEAEQPLAEESTSDESLDLPKAEPLSKVASLPKPAEELVTTSTLSGWERRLNSAINGSADDRNDQSPELEEKPLEKAALEESPEFDFHMDPPSEAPATPESVPAEKVSEAKELFHSATPENVEIPEVPVQEPQIALSDVKSAEIKHSESTKEIEPMKSPHRGNSLVRLATVFSMFGLMGLVLGQYGLLWLRGPSADYLGLTKVTPGFLMPSASSQLLAPQITPVEHLAESPPAEQAIEEDTAINELLAEKPPEPLPAEQLSEQPTEPSPLNAVFQDEAVTPTGADLPAEPIEQPVVLLPPTNTSPQEFASLFQAANQSVSSLQQGALTTQSSVQVKNLKGQAYMALCRLAERVDFVMATPQSAEDANLAEQAQSLLRRLADDVTVRADLAYIAGKWWGYERRPSSGIVLVGRINEVRSQGRISLCQLQLEGASSAQAIPVVFAGSSPERGQLLAIMGAIATSADQSFAEHFPDTLQAVVSHLAIDLPGR